MSQFNRTTTLLSLLLGCLIASSTVFASEWIYTVRPGDKLKNLSEKYLANQANFARLQQQNNIKSPDKLLPGSVIRFPIEWLKIQPSSALVVDGQGDVIITRASSTKISNSTKEVRLYVGDRISTGENSSATLLFADKSRLLLQSNSELIMDKLSVYGDDGMADTRLRLPAGRIDTKVIPRSKNRSRYEITTPAAVAAVRGTEFRVSSEKVKPVSRSEVLKGLIAVDSNGISNPIPGGFGAVSEVGKTPAKPKKLLMGPSLSVPQKLYTSIPIVFGWAELRGAKAYRVQLFNKENLNILLLDKVITKNEYQFNDIVDNRYIFRVRGIDKDKLEGLNSDYSFLVNAIPGQSTLTKPLHNTTLANQKPTFHWAESNGAIKYSFQIASDNAFNNIVVDRSDIIETQHEVIHQLPAGSYYWRVAGIDESGYGAYSKIRTFTIKPILPVLEIQPPIINQDNIQFEWSASIDEVEYYFQFTRDLDENNTDEYKTIITQKTSLILPHPFTGQYFYRVKAVAKDNSHTGSSYNAWKKVETLVETDLPWYMLLLFILLL